MKNTYITNLNLQVTDYGLLFLRVAIAALMLGHGIPKLLMLFGSQEISFADPIGIGETATLTIAVFAEVICSILIAVGLATRVAALVLLFTMAIAFFVVHASDPFQIKELALVYLVVYAFISIVGSGKYALDHYFLKK
ncbi:putative oxidoreductase [Gillisia sp. Hel_I_86]|uniref:DoxX family protein n=1 Tax=Gillisia sp. Hel_I_86 TaxID=1249981 RepID=UPI001199BCE5|nr:DoxX family protein [Gillisia sp. Hel_I_86]TVZ28390.1 putative oxidoreductase [Gillisia sp. Hel_I_86]